MCVCVCVWTRVWGWVAYGGRDGGVILVLKVDATTAGDGDVYVCVLCCVLNSVMVVIVMVMVVVMVMIVMVVVMMVCMFMVRL